MIDMPFTCNILKNHKASVEVDVQRFGNLVQDIASIPPNSSSQLREVIWTNLDYQKVMGLEYWLMVTKATERIKWNGLVYLLEDGYTVDVSDNNPVVTASFRRVA